MRAVIVLIAALALAGAVHAQFTSGYQTQLGTTAPSSPCVGHTVDNGCMAFNTYIATAATQDSNFAFNTAQSGQLTAGATYGSADTLARNAELHENDQYIPGVDYPIGSANPTSLTPISSFVNDSVCAYHASGAPPQLGSGKYLLCKDNLNSTTYTVQGYDFSNNGSGTGTDCVPVEIMAGTANPAAEIHFVNDYWKATGTCWSRVISGMNGVGAIIYITPDGVSNPGAPNIEFDNVTIDGNFENSPNQPCASELTCPGVENAIQDKRAASGSGNLAPTHDPELYLDPRHRPASHGRQQHHDDQVQLQRRVVLLHQRLRSLRDRRDDGQRRDAERYL